jgi:hypothetical protein
VFEDEDSQCEHEEARHDSNREFEGVIRKHCHAANEKGEDRNGFPIVAITKPKVQVTRS